MSIEEENYLWSLDSTIPMDDAIEWVLCDNCENACNCPDANRYDGCDCGLATPE